ncbi:MAG: PAS domain-containing protein [Rhodospirillales bacterium]|nr:PAS domain-containing protein [Rhodospirillales bacterium]
MIAKSTQAKHLDVTEAEFREGEQKIARTSMVIGLIIGLVALAGVAGTVLFVKQERQRDLIAWQARLGLVADGRAAAIADWVEASHKVLRGLADNASLQIYMTEVIRALAGAAGRPTDEIGQLGYLRNLLTALAERNSFTSTQAAVAANIERPGGAGLALADLSGRILVSSPGFPALTAPLRAALLQAADGKPGLADLHQLGDGIPTIGFARPVYAIQESKDSARPIGVILGVKLVGADLFDRLKQPGEVSSSAETYLVRRADQQIEYLSPLADGSRPLQKSLALATPDLADAVALQKPGEFALARDYTGADVLVVSRAIGATPWVLVRKIDRKEALADTESRLTTMLTVFLLIIAGTAVGVVALWRHGSSVRSARAAGQYRKTALHLEQVMSFLKVMSDSQPTQILAVDSDLHITFANAAAARLAAMPAEDLLGKSLSSVWGPVQAEPVIETLEHVLQNGEPARDLYRLDVGGGMRTYQGEHIPLAVGPSRNGILIVLSDITELLFERERGETRLKQLIDLLLNVIDRRDHHTAFHSQRVASLGRAIAKEMELPTKDLETIEMAGRLMNLGKMFIPLELLTKVGDLSAEERRVLHESNLISADLLERVDLEKGVVETIRHLGENYDGSGTLGLSGEAIAMTARVLSVANAFVAMTSPRAYRNPKDANQACQEMMGLIDKRFDKRPVVSLLNLIVNRDGAGKWGRPSEPADGTYPSVPVP